VDLRTAQRILRGDDLRAEAQRVINARRERRVRIATRTPRVPEPPPEEPRAVKVERIRGPVFERAAGVCEFCSTVPLMPNRGRPEEWHHIIGGPLRRQMEAVDTTAAICIPCHRGWDKSDLSVLERAKVWALRHGFRVALRAIEKRIDHVERVRNG
jgi:hypothetical protein